MSETTTTIICAICGHEVGPASGPDWILTHGRTRHRRTSICKRFLLEDKAIATKICSDCSNVIAENETCDICAHISALVHARSRAQSAQSSQTPPPIPASESAPAPAPIPKSVPKCEHPRTKCHIDMISIGIWFLAKTVGYSAYIYCTECGLKGPEMEASTPAEAQREAELGWKRALHACGLKCATCG